MLDITYECDRPVNQAAELKRVWREQAKLKAEIEAAEQRCRNVVVPNEDRLEELANEEERLMCNTDSWPAGVLEDYKRLLQLEGATDVPF